MTPLQAKPEFDRLMRLYLGTHPSQVFTGGVVVEVRGAAVTKQQVAEYLAKATTVIQDTAVHGTGPVPGGHVFVVVPWADLTETTGRSPD